MDMIPTDPVTAGLQIVLCLASYIAGKFRRQRRRGPNKPKAKSSESWDR